jgi:hypothetical protein
MKVYVVLAWLSIGVAFTAKAEPLVTISCEKPEGSSTTYGVPLKERLDALAQEQPEPVNPTLRGPTKNEYQGKPTFVIDSNRKKITIVWSEMLPSLPAADGVVVQFLPEQISAIQVEPWSITTFSFFPKMGTVFIGQQSMALDFHNAMQLSTFARCEFSWSKPQ